MCLARLCGNATATIRNATTPRTNHFRRPSASTAAVCHEHERAVSKPSTEDTVQENVDGQSHENAIRIISNNITSMLTHIDHLTMHYDSDILCAQEVSVAKHQQQYAYDKTTELGFKGYITAPDPELLHATGGVATLMKNKAHYNKLLPITEECAKALKGGRLHMAMATLPNNTYIHICNIYMDGLMVT